MGQLEGKVAVITGSSRGLGYAIAEVYGREGASLVLSARSEKQLQMGIETLKAKGYRVSGLPGDVGDLNAVRALAAHAVSTYGKIDIWVNNAGLAGVFGPTAAAPVERYEQVLKTNIFGTYYGSITALDHFLPQRSGKLINLLGRGDTKPVPLQNAYAPSKTWIRSFTLALAKEYKDSGVGIFAFNPGIVDTEMMHRLEATPGYETRLKPLSTVIQLWGNDPDVPAEKALWLASAATDGKTGLAVNVLSRPELFTGALRFLANKVLRRPQRDATLEIATVARQDQPTSV